MSTIEILTAIINKKSWNLQDFCVKTKTKTIFVLEVPQDQDIGLEDYITASRANNNLSYCLWLPQPDQVT